MGTFQGSFRNLIVWKEAKTVTLDVYRVTSLFPKQEIYGLTSQLRRAASSVMANIAEGNYRATQKDRMHFFIVARGSLAETDCFLDLAFDLKYLPEKDYQELVSKVNKASALLYRLISSLQSPQAR